MITRRIFLVSAAVGATTLVPGALAQRALVVEADRYTLAPEGTVSVRLGAWERTRPAPAAWGDERVEWFFVRDARTQQNHPAAPVDPETAEVRLRADRPGVMMIGVDAEQRVETMPAEAFARLHERSVPAEGGGKPPPRPAEVRVRHVESATVLVRVGGVSAVGSHAAVSKSGLAAEIRALMDPTLLTAGSDLAVRVYAQGGALPGATLFAIHAESGAETRATADDRGIANFRIDRAGVWTIELRSLAPSPDPDADWIVFTGTLTFEVSRMAEEGRP